MDMLMVVTSVIMFGALMVGFWLGARKTKREKKQEEEDAKNT